MFKNDKISLVWDGDLLQIEAYGSFSDSTFAKTLNIIKDNIEKKGIRSFRRLEIWNGAALGSPEVVNLAEKMSKWYKKQGCYAVAMVVTNCIQSHIISKITHNNAIIFNNKKDAIIWLNKQNQ